MYYIYILAASVCRYICVCVTSSTFLGHCECCQCQALLDGSTGWGLPIHATCNDLGHSSINHLKAKAVFTNLVQTSFFLFFSVLFYIYILG